MSERFVVDPPQLDLLLKQLRLPAMRTLWRSFTERAGREDWPAARLLAAPGRWKTPESALQADACPPSRSPCHPAPTCPAPPQRPSSSHS